MKTLRKIVGLLDKKFLTKQTRGTLDAVQWSKRRKKRVERTRGKYGRQKT